MQTFATSTEIDPTSTRLSQPEAHVHPHHSGPSDLACLIALLCFALLVGGACTDKPVSELEGLEGFGQARPKPADGRSDTELSDHEKAMLETLGYLPGYEPGSATSGIAVHDVSRAQAGLSFYTARRDALLTALAAEMPDDAHWCKPRGGLQVWLTLPPGVSGEAVRQTARAVGIVYSPGEACFMSSGGENQLVLSCANQNPEAIAAGISELAAIVSDARLRANRRTG